MRRSLVLSSVLAASVAVLGACDPKANVPPNKPAATPVPVASASPVASPVASPSVSPVKPGTMPEVKKTDDKKSPGVKEVNKGVKLQGTPVKPA